MRLKIWTISAVLISTAAVVILLLLQSTRGFDFTDEGLYLLAVSTEPGGVFHTPFQLPLLPLWQISSGNIVTYRFTGMAVTLVLGIIFGLSVNRYLRIASRPPAKIWIWLLAATVFIGYYGYGLPTPSYNMLTYWGAILAISMALWFLSAKADPNLEIAKIVFALSLSFAASLSFFGKFSAAILISLMIFFAINKKGHSLGNLVTLLVFLMSEFLIVTFISGEGGLIRTMDSVIQGAKDVILMDPTYNPVNSVLILIKTSLVPIAVATLVVAGIRFLSNFLRISNFFQLELALLTLLLTGFATSAPPNSWKAGVFLLTILIWAVFNSQSLNLKKNTYVRLPLLAGAVALASCVVGGNNGFANIGMYVLPFSAMFYLFLRSIEEKKSATIPRELPIAFVLISVSLLAIQNPYRQAPLLEQTAAVQIGQGRLTVNNENAELIKELSKCVQNNSLNSRYVFDFTEYSAGLIYAIGAKPLPNLLGTVWGYPGSSKLLQRELQKLSNEEITQSYGLFDSSELGKGDNKIKSIGLVRNQLICPGNRYSIYSIQD